MTGLMSGSTGSSDHMDERSQVIERSANALASRQSVCHVWLDYPMAARFVDGVGD
jgi:hypothetical protein